MDASRPTPEDPLVTAAVGGDEVAFGELGERHRHELRVHCYRMVGSYHDAEDLVQETLLRAWRKRASYAGRSTFRAWLYKIATNACLDFVDKRDRRAAAYTSPPLVESATTTTAPIDVSWLAPYPDRLLEPAGPRSAEPDEAAVGRETIELAFLVAVQQLPARQRAVLILRDVLGWPATDTAELLGTSVPSTKSALQRARATVREHLPSSRDDWSAAGPSDDERTVVKTFLDAHQRADFDVIAQLLASDVQLTMPPHPAWVAGSDAVVALTAKVLDPESDWYHGQWRGVLTAANRQPAIAHYVQQPSAPETRDLPGEFRAQGVDVLRVRDGRITAITTFEPRFFALFDLPLVLS